MGRVTRGCVFEGIRGTTGCMGEGPWEDCANVGFIEVLTPGAGRYPRCVLVVPLDDHILKRGT